MIRHQGYFTDYFTLQIGSLVEQNSFMIQTQYEISTFFVKSVEGGLILENFSRLLKSPKKGAKNFSLHYPQIEDAKDSDLVLFWGDRN